MATHPMTLVLVLQRGRVLRAVLLSPGLPHPLAFDPARGHSVPKDSGAGFPRAHPATVPTSCPRGGLSASPCLYFRHPCPALSCRSSRQQAPEGLQYLCWRLIDDSIPAHPIPRPCRGAAGRSRATGGAQLSPRLPAPSDQHTSKLRTFNVLPRGTIWVRDSGGASCRVGHL